MKFSNSISGQIHFLCSDIDGCSKVFINRQNINIESIYLSFCYYFHLSQFRSSNVEFLFLKISNEDIDCLYSRPRQNNFRFLTLNQQSIKGFEIENTDDNIFK